MGYNIEYMDQFKGEVLSQGKHNGTENPEVDAVNDDDTWLDIKVDSMDNRQFKPMLALTDDNSDNVTTVPCTK